MSEREPLIRQWKVCVTVLTSAWSPMPAMTSSTLTNQTYCIPGAVGSRPPRCCCRCCGGMEKRGLSTSSRAGEPVNTVVTASPLEAAPDYMRMLMNSIRPSLGRFKWQMDAKHEQRSDLCQEHSGYTLMCLHPVNCMRGIKLFLCSPILSAVTHFYEA